MNESTQPEPSSKRAIARLNTENNWFEYFNNCKLPLQVFRLSGIYSLENNVIKRLQKGTLRIVEKKNHYFSRVHIEDIAEVLMLSLKKNTQGKIFNISDNHPCSNEELAKYAANLINVQSHKKYKLVILPVGW